MYSLGSLPAGVRTQIQHIFTPDNYCFATVTDERSPTFYFATGGMQALQTGSPCGRLRTSHANGPLIDITTYAKSHRFFASLAMRDEVGHAMSKPAPGTAEGLLGRGQVNAFNGAQHLEVTMKPSGGRPYSRTHRSGGKVSLDKPGFTPERILKLIDMLLGEECKVEVDGIAAGAVASGAKAPPHAPKPGIANFMAAYIN